MKHFISTLTDFMTSHKITFYSKFYDIDFLEIYAHDITDISLYMYASFFVTKETHVLP